MGRPPHSRYCLGPSLVLLIPYVAKLMPLQVRLIHLLADHRNTITLERRKRALLIGINYNDGPGNMRLKSPQSDMKKVHQLLTGEAHGAVVWRITVLIAIIFHAV